MFTWIRIEFQSGSDSFRFCWDHWGLNYICLYESGLSCNSFQIEFIPFFIPDWTLDPEWNVDSESCKLGLKFHSWMKLGMKSTFIMAEIKIVCKMGSFIHVFKCISAKITGKIRSLVHESETSFNPEWDFHSQWSFSPQLNLPCKHELSLKCRSGLKLNPDSCKLPLSPNTLINQFHWLEIWFTYGYLVVHFLWGFDNDFAIKAIYHQDFCVLFCK